MKIKILLISILLVTVVKIDKPGKIYYREQQRIEELKKEMQFLSALIHNTSKPMKIWYKKYENFRQKLNETRRQINNGKT
ncbi:MAG: hypothetical protein K9L56_14425 [Clostridiales bacterium]|nr:hypothetical protein [Clostridiales bacterium]